MVAVGREAHPRITENLARIDPEGVAEIWISPDTSNGTGMPARTSIPIRSCMPQVRTSATPSGVESSVWIAFPAVWLRHRRLPSVTASAVSPLSSPRSGRLCFPPQPRLSAVPDASNRGFQPCPMIDCPVARNGQSATRDHQSKNVRAMTAVCSILQPSRRLGTGFAAMSQDH